MCDDGTVRHFGSIIVAQTSFYLIVLFQREHTVTFETRLFFFGVNIMSKKTDIIAVSLSAVSVGISTLALGVSVTTAYLTHETMENFDGQQQSQTHKIEGYFNQKGHHLKSSEFKTSEVGHLPVPFQHEKSWDDLSVGERNSHIALAQSQGMNFLMWNDHVEWINGYDRNVPSDQKNWVESQVGNFSSTQAPVGFVYGLGGNDPYLYRVNLQTGETYRVSFNNTGTR